ncbi:MAG: sulfite exporter TauE/SafE family protein [Patescibacteria group bacterium]|nr:sulfite exporter TauE/SafE family protein [Patescibacteria group bacterium]
MKNAKKANFCIENTHCASCGIPVRDTRASRLLEAAVIAMILMLLYFIAGEFAIVPAKSISELSLGSAFLLGMVASVSTCMATTGGLYLATIGKLHVTSHPLRERIVPSVSFNLGRIGAYALMGAVNGYVGRFVTVELNMGVTLNVVVGVLLVFIGLDMLRILPLNRIVPNSWLKRFILAVERRLLTNPRRTAFALGAITYWLPCGFTQSVQLYALSVADPVQSMLIMTFFALGATPAMLAIGFASSMMRSSWYGWFVKGVAVLITLVGISYILAFLTVYGINPLDRLSSWNASDPAAPVRAEQQPGMQIIRTTVTNRGYYPLVYIVEQGKPVKWILEGKDVYGCQSHLMAPKINVETVLKNGENVISFLPQETGEIGFSCSMGKYQGKIRVVEGG